MGCSARRGGSDETEERNRVFLLNKLKELLRAREAARLRGGGVIGNMREA
jgi:hypothetical protein